MADVLSVSAMNIYVRSLLEGDGFLQDISVRGEISNFHKHFKTGHCYFTLKDEKSSVKAVMFAKAASSLSFVPQDGMRIIARGRASLFERDGAFQFYAEHLFPDGVGAAQMAFEQLRARLEAEGLFAPEAKRPLPSFPRYVGVVTSKNGAALQDVLKVAARRCPNVCFLLAPVSVQGKAAASEVATAIRALDEDSRADVILVTRGGGSAEDLGVFNAEEIARAAWSAQTPLVSAVGHEVDYTILDFVADLRAATPSAAAEMILPDLTAVLQNAMYIYKNVEKNIQIRRQLWYNELLLCRRSMVAAPLPARLAAYSGNLGRVAGALNGAVEQKRQAAGQRVVYAAQLAQSLSPYQVLARGYAVVRKEGKILRSFAEVRPGERLAIQLADGAVNAVAEEAFPDK